MNNSNELSAALDRALDELLGIVSTKSGSTLFHIAAENDAKLRKLDTHWWTKLGRFLHVI